MLIVMRHGAPEEDIRRVAATIEEMGYQARPMPGKQRTTVGLVGNDGRVDASRLAPRTHGQARETSAPRWAWWATTAGLTPPVLQPCRACRKSSTLPSHISRCRENGN